MKTRINSKKEFVEKFYIAEQIQQLIKSKKATKNHINTFLVLMSELKQFKNNHN